MVSKNLLVARLALLAPDQNLLFFFGWCAVGAPNLKFQGRKNEKNHWALLVVIGLSAILEAFAAPVMTRFNPSIHGFRFANSFANDFVPALDVRTGGLCGGMAYAALDYFFAGRAIPNQDYRPANRTPLQSYLYNRQVHSAQNHLEKWAELGFNPGGSRNSEFFNWGLQAGPGGRMTELRSRIDAGVPVAIGLQQEGTGSHQFVAIGYDLGRYRGDLGSYKEDFKIFVYDNNHPGVVKTLVPDVASQVYKYTDSDETWRAYFVQTNYSRSSPPAIVYLTYPNDGRVYELLLHFFTGNDDLRGGNDNVNLSVRLASGLVQNYPNINLGGRWLSNYEETVRVRLSSPVAVADLAGLTISTTFSGGLDGDNWDMKKVSVRALGGNLDRVIKEHGFKRFTGSDRSLVPNMSTAPIVPLDFADKIYLYLKTGGADLRGGNDNYNVNVFFSSGTRMTFNNVNGSGRYADGSEHVEFLNLTPRSARPGQINRVEIQTTFGGGMGGGNWNLDRLEIRAIGPGVNTKIGEAGPKRFTGDDRVLSINTRPIP